LAIFVPVSFVVVALKGSALGVFAILGLIFATFALVCWLIALSLAAIFMKDFIIPIMYIRRCKIIAAWQEFFSMIRGNLWRFFCYILFKIVIAFCVSTIAALAICLSCCSCCLWIIFVIPYISTVAMLPLISFGRLYPLCYLRQYGPELDVFSAVAVQDKPN